MLQESAPDTVGPRKDLLGTRIGSRSLASKVAMAPSAEVAKSSVPSEPMQRRSTAVLKQRYSWNSPVKGSR